MRHSPLVRCSVAAALWWSAPAFAGAQVRRDTAQALHTVSVTAHRVPATAGGAGTLAARVDSLPVEVAPSLETALRRLPFVLVRTNTRGESELSVRGSESRTPTVLLDGLPLSIGWDSRSDPSLIPLAGVSTIRVTRSMTSVLAGPNAVGGTVEMDFASAPIARPMLAMASGFDQLGSAALSAAVLAPATIGDNDVTARAGFSYRNRPALARPNHVNDPDAPSGERTNSDLRSVNAFAAARLTALRGAYVSAGVVTNSVERGVQPELHVDEPRRWRYPSQTRLIASLGAGTGTRSLLGRTVALDASLGVTTGESAIEVFTDGGYSQVDGRETGDERTVVGRAVLTHALPGTASLRMGGSIASVRYLEGFDNDPLTRFAQRLWNVGADATVPISERVTLSAGAGFDGANNSETGGRAPLDPRDDWTGRIGLTATRGATRVHAAASQRSRFPALRELYSGALGRFQPNPDLRPERLTTIEGGATHSRGALELQVLAFHQTNDDGIVRTTLPDRKFFRVNRDEIRSAGLESVVSWSRAGATVYADALVQRVRVYDVTAGNAERRAEHVPATRATLGAAVPTVAGVQATAWVTHTGVQYCTNPSGGAQLRLGNGTRVDVSTERAWGLARGWFRELRATLAVDNVVNGAIYDQCGMPQPGRTVRAGLALR